MKKLKTILLYSLIIFSIFYVFYFTIICKYDSIYKDENDFKGIITDYKIDGNKLSINFKDKEKLIGINYFNNIDEKNYYINNIKYGSKIIINGNLTIPQNNSIFNNFNYKKYLYNKKIYRIVNINKIEIDNNINFFYRIKNYINNIILKRENSSYLKTFILGDKSLLDNSDYAVFQKLGITHLFAISGMHISLFVIIIMFILHKLKLKDNIIYLFIIIFLGLYCMLLSFSPSIRRSYILFILISIKKIFNLNMETLVLLIICICINVLIDPFIIYDTGFLYSIITTFGLIISSKYINKGNYLKRIFKVSLIAYLFSLPITVNNYYEINLLTPFNNLIIVPLISFIIYPLSLITIIINNPIFNYFVNLLLFINNILLKINIFYIIIPKLNIIFILLYYLFLVLFIKCNKKYIIICLLIILSNKLLYKFDNNNYVYYLDVDQGDSSIIISSYKKDITMIDTGGKIGFNNEDWQRRKNNFMISSNIILFLKSNGINHIDNLIITHGDYDHMGEAINLVENFKVEKVIFNCGSYNDLEQELIKVLDKKKIKYNSCIKELNVDKNKLYFLQTKEYDNENDNSNVIYTELDGYKFMFMGDASVTTEKEIMNKYNLPDIDVLKVGHHGSKTSSGKEFINEINPKYSIISVGKNNRYGHPNKEVLNTLEQSIIYRTDQDGSIMFKIKNNKLKIETCSP